MTADKESESSSANVEHLDAVNTVQRQQFRDFAEKPAEWRKAQDARIVRKVDLHLIPFLVFMYLLNFLDRSNLAQARQVCWSLPHSQTQLMNVGHTRKRLEYEK